MLKRSTRIAVISVLAFLGSCESARLDRKMEELCSKDGGVTVFESVVLAAEMFDQNGDAFPGWQNRKPQDRLGPHYSYEQTETILKDGDPLKGEGRLVRRERRITRIADRKLLGMSVSYGRSGGDFIVVDHFTSAHCPTEQRSDEVIRQVFVRQASEQRPN